MLIRNKKLIWGVLWILTLLAIYVFGYQHGQDVSLRNFIKQYKVSEIGVGYGRYIEYRDISKAIDDKRYDYVKCSADLGASSLYDDLTACLSDKECSKQIVKDKEYKIAPELFDRKPKGFKYYPLKDGIRSCKE